MIVEGVVGGLVGGLSGVCLWFSDCFVSVSCGVL